MSSEVVAALRPPIVRHRFTSLDGLRGVAALVVVFHHALLTVPTLATAYYPSRGDVPAGSLWWVLTYTPLHLLWAGTEAVCLFFVLSGFVLVLPVLRPGFSWSAYYVKRVLRLYGPVVAASLLGLLTIVVVQRFNGDELGAWVNARPNRYSLDSLWRDITLVNGASGVISPLWSLQWEVLFSLALPLYVVFARARVPGWLTYSTAMALVVWSSLGRGEYLYYLPMFAVGAVLVVHWGTLKALAARVDRTRGAWPVIVVVAILLTCARWELIGLGLTEARAARHLWVTVIGVTLLVLIAALCGPVKAVLQQRWAQWLGSISFSLYLVHEPIVLAVRFLTVQHSPWLGIMISVPLAVGVAVVFARLVEQPVQRLARRIGVGLEQRIGR